MIDKADWEAAYRELIEEGRQEIGDPPDFEELLAFSRGELSEEKAARVRGFLVYYPEVAQAFSEPFPEPGEAGLSDLTDEEMTEDWAALRAKLRPADPPPPREPVPVPFVEAGNEAGHFGAWLRSLWAPGPGQLRFAVATAFAVVLGGLYLRELIDIRRPRALAHHILLPDGQRGATQPPIELRENADFVLAPSLIGKPAYPEYHLDILSLNEQEPKQIWSTSELPQQDGSLAIVIPDEFLKPGEYRLELFGLAEGRRHLLATYTVRRPVE